MAEIPGINIDLNIVRGSARKVQDCCDTYAELSRRLYELSGEVEEAWQSAYTSSYTECVEKTARDLAYLSENVGNIARSLRSTADAVDNAEKTVISFYTGG